jgi:hypothetical protein
MVGASIEDSRVLSELSRRFRESGNHEYFLRLLDYYLFSSNKLRGITREQIEGIFGPGKTPQHMKPSEGGSLLTWDVPPDSLTVEIKDGRVAWAFYVMGF